jgi:hypothetical protein
LHHQSITVGRAKNASSAMEARDLMAEGIRTLENYYLTTPEATALEQLADIQKDLRRIPMVELNVPTVVLVGGDDDHRIVMNVDEMMMLGYFYHHTSITITLSLYNYHQSSSQPQMSASPLSCEQFPRAHRRSMTIHSPLVS